MHKRTPMYKRQPYNAGQLGYINFQYIKALCDSNNVQMNIIFSPDFIQIRISSIDPVTQTLRKSETHNIKNQDIGSKFTTTYIEMILRNVITNWYPSTMMTT
jgi:hypothetical protein